VTEGIVITTKYGKRQGCGRQQVVEKRREEAGVYGASERGNEAQQPLR
jgi:hypothetical protein